MSGSVRLKANQRYIYKAKRQREFESPTLDPLTATLYREFDDDEQSYTFHLADLKLELEKAFSKKRDASYDAEEERSKELAEINFRLNFIGDYFLGVHDGFNPENQIQKPSTADAGKTLFAFPERVDELTEAIVNVANRYIEAGETMPRWPELWNYFLDNVTKDELLSPLWVNDTDSQRPDGVIYHETRTGKSKECNREAFSKRCRRVLSEQNRL